MLASSVRIQLGKGIYNSTIIICAKGRDRRSLQGSDAYTRAIHKQRCLQNTVLNTI